MLTILLVESDPAVSRVMGRLLQAEGFAVIPASGAREALTLLRRERSTVALVAAEWEPPDMGGDAFLEGVERVAPGTPLLRLSPGMALIGHADRRADPAVASKPFRADDLPRHVRAALGLPPREGMERRHAARVSA